MELLITIVVFIDSAAIAFCLGYLIAEKLALRNRPSLLEANEPGFGGLRTRQEIKRAVMQLGCLAPKPRQEAGRIKQSLVQAGYRNASAPALFYGLSAVSTVLLPSLFSLYQLVSGRPMAQALLAASLAAIVGYLAPRWTLRSMVRARQEKIRLALPQALDLMIVCVDVGMGLDQSLAKVSEHLREIQPEIAEELGLVILEMRTGRPRADAFHALGRRTGLEEIGSFIAALIQADRFGTSIAHSLRIYAEELRVRRRQRAEEMAAKIPVKLVFPIFFFIFPAIFVITAAPAVLRLLRELLPIIRG